MSTPGDHQDGQDGTILHASCVAFDGRGVLITGASGSGKSALALHLLALGGTLVSDDRVRLARAAGSVHASAPDAITGMIEARGVGLLRAPAAQATLALAVDLDAEESQRLPPWREIDLLGCSLPLLRRVSAPHFAPAIVLFLRHGRTVPGPQ